MVPNDLYQGVAAALYLHNQLHGRTYYQVDDQEDYGVPLAEAMNRQARRLGEDEVGVGHITVTPSGAADRAAVARLADQIVSVTPDAVYCGCDADPSAQLAHALDARGFHGAFFVPDEEHNPDWLKLAGQLHTAYATDPGVDDNRAAGWFQRAFTARFHAATQLFDSYAYDAAATALRALLAAATHHQLSGSISRQRRAVVRYVRNTCFYGASGPVSFDANGDSNHRSVSVYAGELGSWHLRTVVRLGSPLHC
jgi:branched-chain amino acid transport system substrate-binding protein